MVDTNRNQTFCQLLTSGKDQKKKKSKKYMQIWKHASIYLDLWLIFSYLIKSIYKDYIEKKIHICVILMKFSAWTTYQNQNFVGGAKNFSAPCWWISLQIKFMTARWMCNKDVRSNKSVYNIIIPRLWNSNRNELIWTFFMSLLQLWIFWGKKIFFNLDKIID